MRPGSSTGADLGLNFAETRCLPRRNSLPSASRLVAFRADTRCLPTPALELLGGQRVASPPVGMRVGPVKSLVVAQPFRDPWVLA